MKKDRKKLIKKVKNERGAITALVLASLLVIAIVLINLYMMGSNKSNSQDKEIKMIEEAYNSGEDKTDSEYKETTAPTTASANTASIDMQSIIVFLFIPQRYTYFG